MIIYAHRGIHDRVPENSIASIECALTSGVVHVEIDVRKCKTGELVVFHDRNLKRMTGLRKFVINTPYSIIQNLHLINADGSKTYFHIPLLREVLEKYGYSLSFILDIKKETWVEDGLEITLINMLQDLSLIHNVIISSFNPFVLKRIADVQPDIHLGLIVSHPIFIPVMDNKHIQSYHVPYNYLTHPFVNKKRNAGKLIFTWTVNDTGITYNIVKQQLAHAIISDKANQLISEIIKK